MKIISKSCLALVMVLTMTLCALIPWNTTVYAAGEEQNAAEDIQTVSTAAGRTVQNSLDMPYETVEYRGTPAAAGSGSWALINLITAALTVIGAGLALIRRKDNSHISSDEKSRRFRIAAGKTIGVAAAALSVIVFVLTEDMSLRIAHVDRWTIVMIIILAVQAVSAATVCRDCRGTAEDTDDEECYQL